MGHHVSGTDFVAVSPVLIGGQDAVVVHIFEVQAILDDDTAGGDADGGAVLVAEQHGLQIKIVDLFAFFQDIGSGDIAVFQIGIDGDRILFHGILSFLQ